MERRDPIAYVLSGIGYKATGCGLRGGYLAHGKIPSAFAVSFATHDIGLRK